MISSSIERYRFREAQQELMNLARLGNKYLADEEPWKVIKVDEARVQTIMYVALQIASCFGNVKRTIFTVYFYKLKNILECQFRAQSRTHGMIFHTKDILLPSGHQIGEANCCFQKLKMKLFKSN